MFANIGGIKKGDVLRYMFMPQVLPRIGQFYTTGFSQLAYFIALVYRAVNILPQGHAIFRPENRHHLGLRQVLALAAAELSFTKSNIDKIIVYFAVLVGIVILTIQFFMLLSFIMMNPAWAGTMPTTYAGFFETPEYATDVAYRLLYMTFGVPELFNPTAATGGGVVRPFHLALYSLFQLYSIGLLVIALLIAFYMVFAILAETASTGVPFGKRYNQVWAPIRFIFALGLLIPTGYGLNSAQWITLYAAKFGSDFATRGWIIFNDRMTTAYLNSADERIGKPQAPELTNLAAYMMIVTACDYAYDKLYQGDNPINIDPYLPVNAATSAGPPATLGATSFEEAKKLFKNGDILIRFGDFNATKNMKDLGFVHAYCGDIVIMAGDAEEPGALSIQKFYYETVRGMWTSKYEIRKYGEAFMGKYSEDKLIKANNASLPDSKYKQKVAEQLTKDVEAAIKAAVTAQQNSDTWKNDAKEIKARGWGGAGIWYNKIAQINGSLVTAVNNVPQPRLMPEVMEYVKAEKLAQNTEIPEPFKPNLADQKELRYNTVLDAPIGNGLSLLYDYWNKEDTRQDNLANQTRFTNNIFIDAVNLIFGTRGLFDMCASANVHPLAQLSTLGKGLIEASIRNLAVAVGVGALTLIPVSFIGIAASAASSLLLTVAGITLSIGFILFYVLPFMPFLYFFFAVGGWIKGLFEAMVGVPLWALAHMRIDGEGLPGDAAINGYFLIFEIFLRPILIVFGLLASVVIFAAMVKVLNEIFYLVVVNLAGHDENTKTLCGQISGTSGSGTGTGSGTNTGQNAVTFFRGPIDELFFTVIYAIIVYMIGLSCFKLIDLVPNNLLRYMNVNVATFNDQAGDPAEGLLTKISIGGNMVTNQVLSIGKGAAGALGNLTKFGIETSTAAGPGKQQDGQ